MKIRLSDYLIISGISAIMLMLIASLIPPARAQLAVGTRAEPMMVITNTGRVYSDTGAVTASEYTFDKPCVLSNADKVIGGSLRGCTWGVTNISVDAITNSSFNVTNVNVIVITNLASGVEWMRWEGLVGGRPGQQVKIINTLPNSMAIAHAGAAAGASNFFHLCGLQTTFTNTVSQGVATFIYGYTNWWLDSITY